MPINAAHRTSLPALSRNWRKEWIHSPKVKHKRVIKIHYAQKEALVSPIGSRIPKKTSAWNHSKNLGCGKKLRVSIHILHTDQKFMYIFMHEFCISRRILELSSWSCTHSKLWPYCWDKSTLPSEQIQINLLFGTKAKLDFILIQSCHFAKKEYTGIFSLELFDFTFWISLYNPKLLNSSADIFDIFLRVQKLACIFTFDFGYVAETLVIF